MHPKKKKKSLFLNNPLFGKPKTDQNWLKPKYTETDWFLAISVSFGWEFHKPKYSVSVDHTHKNRSKLNWAHP